MAQHSHSKGVPSVIEALDGELMCGVCLQPYERPLLLPCGHNFCTHCIEGIIRSGPDYLDFSFVSVGPPNSFMCPVCQTSINLRKHSLESLPVNKALENVVFIFKNHVPTDIFDYAWNTDMKSVRSKCDKHGLLHEEFCESCEKVICRKCKDEGHSNEQGAKHKTNNLNHTVAEYQSKIARLLTEIKKKNILLNERIQLLQDVLKGIETNQEKVCTQLDHQVSNLISSIRQQQEKLKQVLVNDLNEIGLPISEELRKCRSMKTTMQEMMKKLSKVRQTHNLGLQIHLMKDDSQYLEKLLHDELPLFVDNQEIPEVTMPTLVLHTQPLIESVKQLNWTCKEEEIPKLQPDHIPTLDSKQSQGPDPSSEGRQLDNSNDRTLVERQKGVSVYENHKHLRPSCSQPTRCETEITSSDNTHVVTHASSGAKVTLHELSGANGTLQEPLIAKETPLRSAAPGVTPHKPKESPDGQKAFCDLTQSQAASFDEPDGDMPPTSANRSSLTDHVSVETSEAANSVKHGALVDNNNGNPKRETSLINDSVNENQTNVEQTGPHITQQNRTVRAQPTGTSLVNNHVTEHSVMTLDIASPEVAEKFFKRGERRVNHSEPPSKDSATRKMAEEARKKEKRKKSKRSGYDLFRDVDTSPTTTSEALASFVARRKTISPASSVSRNLDTWSVSRDGHRKSDTSAIRQSLSDTKLLSPTLKPVQFDTRVMELESSPSSKLLKSSGHVNRKNKSPVVLTVQSSNSKHETTNEQLSPKSFLKQPISVNLDFELDSTPRSSRNVKGHETQI